MTNEQILRIEKASKHNIELFQIIKYLFKVDPVDQMGNAEDMKRNTDYMLPDGTRIACRVRSRKYYEDYPNEIVMRDTPKGKEFDKFLSGFGDFYLYCYGENESIFSFMLIDLRILRNLITENDTYNNIPSPGDDFGGVIINLRKKTEAIIAKYNHPIKAGIDI